MTDRSSGNPCRAVLLAGIAAAALVASAGIAAAQAEPIVIGITSDASGQYANSGASDRRGMMMAIEEFNAKGGVLGRPIETVHIDTETTPATGSRVAERMITRDGADFLIGAVSSGVANAISQVAQKYGIVYLNTNSSSPTESGENCHRVKFVWDGNGINFAQAAVKSAVETYGAEVAAADQRLRLGPRHLRRDPDAGRGHTARRSSTRC